MVNPIFYKSIVPLNRERHRDLAISNAETRFGFARQTHIVPAVIDEFPVALTHLPIVFVPSSPHPTSVFLVGLRPSQNLLVDETGRWTAGYLPAFLRRYPFIQGDLSDRNPVTCIDEQSDLFAAGDGRRLFDQDGSESPLLTTYVELVGQYYQAALRTETFLTLVNELSLLRPVTIESKFDAESSAILHGCMTIDEEKLNALPQSDFLRLRDGGFLAAIYAHLFSLRSVDVLRRAVDARNGRADDGDAAPGRDDSPVAQGETKRKSPPKAKTGDA